MKKIVLYGWMTICFSLGLQAQEETDFQEFGLVRQQDVIRPTRKPDTFSANNIVTIQQVGSGNRSDVTVKALQSSVDIRQWGNQNTLELYKNAREINQSVIQKGNNNSISDFSVSPYNASNTQVIQYGNNLNYSSYGANSISDDMKIIQKGNSGTVLIFNR